MELSRVIILKTVHFSDTQKIIHAYSKERGYISFISPSAIFKRRSQPVHLLQITEIEFFENEKGNLYRLNTAFPLVNLPNLYLDIFKMNIIVLWGEVLGLILKNEGKNEDLFDFIAKSVEYLNATPKDSGNFNLFFLYRLAGFIGFRIDTSAWQEGAIFYIHDGCFHTDSNLPGGISGPNTARIINLLCSCPIEDVKNIPLNQESRNILLDIIFLYYSIHLNVNFNIKSIQVIREVFA